ncbi:Ig-like domain-containing protein [Halalkalibaculum sp. DA384]|uniref:Ig-like domain-containing protein n=1 Tax=Halalkalibaculum sp. DA384 TaxID=3373606 RepID=UPI003754A1ED
MRLELSDALKKGLTLLYTSLTTFRQQIRIVFLLLMFCSITGLTYGKAYLDTKTVEFDEPTFSGEFTNKSYLGNDVKEDSAKVDNMDNHSTSHETFIVDNTPPTLNTDASMPVNGARQVSANTNIELVFSEPIEAGNGNITIIDETYGQEYETFDLATGSSADGGVR